MGIGSTGQGRTRRVRVGRVSLAIGLVIAATAAAIWVATGAATAATAAPLVGVQSGRCLDVKGGVATPGTVVQIWDCTGQAHQAWSLTAAGELRTINGSVCLDAFNNQTTPGTKLEIWTCTDGQNQKFHLNTNGTITGDQSGLCLDVAGKGTANGAAVTLWTCNGQSNQQWKAGAGTPPPTPTATPSVTPSAGGGGSPYGDPNLVSMFDGKTLAGWTSSDSSDYNVQDGAIHTLGKNRGWIYYNRQVGTFRWIFKVRQLVGNHMPSVLYWGTTNPIRDALSGLQFEPPANYTWDYRPGHNDGGVGIVRYPLLNLDVHMWNQCEVIGNMTTGVAKIACAAVPANGGPNCAASPVAESHDITAGRVGPLAIQVHNSGIQDEYKDLYLESPVVLRPDQFLTIGCTPTG